jgi:hypothetical protein
MLYGGRPVLGCLRDPDFAFEEIHAAPGDQSALGPTYPPIGGSWKLTGERADGLLRMEENRPGGYAHSLFVALTGAIAEFEPVEGISRHFHSCIVTVEGCLGGNSDRTMFGPEVATNFDEFQELLRAGRQTAPAGCDRLISLGQQMGQHASRIPGDPR